MTDMIKKVAQALRKKCAEIDQRPGVHHADAMWFADEYAKAAIAAYEAALEAQGLVIVPREPTNKMIEELYGRFVSATAHKHRIDGYKAMPAALEGKDD